MKESNEVKTPQSDESKHAQKERMKKMLIYPLMVLICGVSIYFIFAPSEEEKAQEQDGFNTEIPMPKGSAMTDDKKSAYEQAGLEQKKKERNRSMQDLASMFGDDEELNLLPEEETEPRKNYGGSGGTERPYETIQNSNKAYKDINRQLGNFYETPKEDPEKEELAKQVEELNAKLLDNATKRNPIDEQVALMEKSYELAAKYMPSGQQQGSPFVGSGQAVPTNTPASVNGKIKAAPVKSVTHRTVSGLPQEISDSVFMADYSKPRNMSFHTAVGTGSAIEKNTIKACVHETTTLTDGQSLRLRLLEPLQAGTTIIPRNSIITGTTKITGERLDIEITSLEYGGMIIPVELSVYDTDGQAGIFIPGSMEMNAVKEMAANMGSSLGTSVSITNQGAGDQLLAELGKGVIQGGSQYLAKKFRIVKVTVKAEYNLMLFADKN